MNMVQPRVRGLGALRARGGAGGRGGRRRQVGRRQGRRRHARRGERRRSHARRRDARRLADRRRSQQRRRADLGPDRRRRAEHRLGGRRRRGRGGFRGGRGSPAGGRAIRIERVGVVHRVVLLARVAREVADDVAEIAEELGQRRPCLGITFARPANSGAGIESLGGRLAACCSSAVPVSSVVNNDWPASRRYVSARGCTPACARRCSCPRPARARCNRWRRS